MPLRKLHRFLLLPLALSLTAVTVALACGPDFYSILWGRRTELSKPVQGNFLYDASHLAARPAKVFPGDDVADADTGTAATKPVPAEYEGLSATQSAVVQKMRAAADGDAAYALGTELPVAVRLYTAAAVDYRLAQRGFDCVAGEDPKQPNPECAKHDALRAAVLQRAVKRFESVLQLPDGERRLRATWSAYSLGLAHGLSGDLYSVPTVDKYFEQTRELAKAPNPDPAHLALDSFGAQALVHLNAGDIPRAMELYAEQAAHGSKGGVTSVSLVCQQLLKDPVLLRSHIQSAVVQKAVIAFVLAYGDDLEAPGAGLAASQESSEPGAAPAGGAPPSRAPQKTVAPAKPSGLALVVNALDSAQVKNVAYADRLAAASYRYGRFDMAQRFAAGSNTMLALWVRAKLALRAGHTDGAAKLFSQALAQLKAQDAATAPLQEEVRQRLVAESAVHTLTRGEFLQGFQQMYSVGQAYWLDVAYLAERVLTTDELKAYVDQHVPEFPPPPHAEKEHRRDVQTQPEHDLSAKLRDLLARRLMREGRHDQAYAYFHADNDDRFGDTHAREDAKAYAHALRNAQSAWTDIGRAKALYQAASLARWKGMDILGFELGPDYFAAAGDFEAGTPEPQRGDMAQASEIARHKASAAAFDKRFHYRYIATQLALQSAQALPHRSQTYALVLSNACSWLIDRDEEEALKAYQLYIANGARMDWSTPFGRTPEDPSFWRAYVFQARQMPHQLRLWARHHKPIAWVLIVAGGLGLAGAAWWVFQRITAR